MKSGKRFEAELLKGALDETGMNGQWDGTKRQRDEMDRQREGMNGLRENRLEGKNGTGKGEHGGLTLIMPRCRERQKTERMRQVLSRALEGVEVKERIEFAEELHPLIGERILFAVMLGASGINLEYYGMLKQIRLHPEMFENCVGAVIVDGLSELYTKSLSRSLVFAANQAGCAFIGRPLVEGTESLANFHVQAQIGNTDQLGAYFNAASDLVQRLLEHKKVQRAHPKLLALHASSHRTSNTLALWEKVKGNLTGCEITEIGLRNGEVSDCAGCPYITCMYFGEKGGCLYGGVMVEAVFPAVRDCDGLILLCPNYNDALSANLTAFINRLTALFRTVRFYEKQLFGVVVSGYSGSDIIAEQLIAALCMNKSFFLPARFCMMETANHPGSILKLPGIEERAAVFARRIEGLRG